VSQPPFSDPSIRKIGVTYSDNIYIPSHLKITPTLFSILKFVAERQRTVVALHSFEKHPYYYLTVDYLPEILKRDPTLREEEKGKKAVDEALKQMLDVFTGGKVKYGYLYPILIQEERKIITKICIIAPQIEHETPIAPLRRNCFDFSKKVMDSILSNRVKRNREIEEKYPYSVILKLNSESVYRFYPTALSLESDLNVLIKKAFAPFSPIAMTDFLSDFIVYGKSLHRLVEVLPDYHIIDEELEVDAQGNLTREPNIYFHFFTLLKATEELVIGPLYELAKQMGYFIPSNHIYSHRENFSALYSEYPENEIPRLVSLKDCLDHFPEDKNLIPSDKNLIEGGRKAYQILKALESLFPLVKQKKDSQIIQGVVQTVADKIIAHLRDKKTLYVLDTGTVIKASGVQSGEMRYELEKAIRAMVIDRFPQKESRTTDNKVFYYVGYYPIMSAVVFNLSRLSFHNDSYTKQHEIAQAMYDAAFYRAHPDLDIELEASDQKEIQKGKENLAQLIERQKKKQEFEDSYNFQAGFFGLGFSFFYFFILYLFFKNNTLLYIMPVVSIFTAYMLTRVFSKRGFRKPITETETKKDLGEISATSLNQIQSIIYQPSQSTIEERIFDRNSFHELIIKNIDEIKATHEEWKMEANNDSLVLRIESALLTSMAVVQVPKDQVPKSKPATVLFFRDDLKDSSVRGKLADYYHFRRSAAKSTSTASNNVFSYYNFLYNAVERDYYKYTK
jgi:hypothetical protein